MTKEKEESLYAVAFGLAIVTIIYNIAEGLVSIYFGYTDESLALFGFGVDSYIEVISGLGIAHMVVRIRKRPKSPRDQFERTALRITGSAFFGLAIGLVATGAYNIWRGHGPETTLWGIIISIVSIFTMWALMFGKKRVGRRLGSDAIIADANCTKICIYMSVILLASSAIYELTGFGYIDSIGSLGLAFVSIMEGRECIEKARNKKVHCCDACED